jgi:uncharacterized protein (TIGR02996 family)
MARDRFLAAVLADPDDDDARRVYAEHLGGERGEYIALSLRRRSSRKVQVRAAELLAAGGAAWIAPFRRAVKSCQWSRGFVERAIIEARAFARHGASLFEREPVTALYVLACEPRDVAAFARVPGVGAIRELGLSRTKLDGPSLGKLVRSLRGVRTLGLAEHDLSDGGAEALATATLPALTHLSLARCNLTAHAIATLAGSRTLASVEELNVSGNDVTPEAAHALASSPYLANLRVLDVCDTAIGTAGARALAKLPRLRELVVHDTGLDPVTLRAVQRRLRRNIAATARM